MGNSPCEACLTVTTEAPAVWPGPVVLDSARAGSNGIQQLANALNPRLDWFTPVGAFRRHSGELRPG